VTVSVGIDICLEFILKLAFFTCLIHSDVVDLDHFGNIVVTLFGLLVLTLAPIALDRLVDCEVNGKSVDPNNGSSTAGVTDLIQCVERDSHLIAREQAIVNAKGNRDGSNKTYSQSRILLTDKIYAQGANIGLQKSFCEAGSLLRLYFYEKLDTRASEFIDSHEIAFIEFISKRKLKYFSSAAKAAITFLKF
jgi:hypothetical protein